MAKKHTTANPTETINAQPRRWNWKNPYALND
jgi:hypothetical protein